MENINGKDFFGEFEIMESDGQKRRIVVENGEILEMEGEGTVDDWKEYFEFVGCEVLS